MNAIAIHLLQAIEQNLNLFQYKKRSYQQHQILNESI